jgi:hypothetical protein
VGRDAEGAAPRRQGRLHHRRAGAVSESSSTTSSERSWASAPRGPTGT